MTSVDASTIDLIGHLAIGFFWLCSLVLVFFVMTRIQKDQSDMAQKNLKLKDDEIEKQTSAETLDELVDSNNKDRKG